ncbi:60S ribosomal protein L12 [Saguinus oedipus]|uniref:60S ribosomal protein L12 n=1 Tax=Saguinus oedipus TaxID=9490 RepID=A0ABQ9UMR6_SAGOE|nr:60S ribosomal protein L12 [Saguinus oedipus]
MLLKFHPNKIKVVYLRYTRVKSMPHLHWPPRWVPRVCLQKKVGDEIAKATSNWKSLRITGKLTIQNRQAQIEAVPSPSALIIKALKEWLGGRKKQETIQQGENITFDEIVNTARRCSTDL